MWKVKKIQLIWYIHILFQQHFESVSSVHFEALMMKKLRYKYYNKHIATCDNDNAQSHDQKENQGRIGTMVLI